MSGEVRYLPLHVWREPAFPGQARAMRRLEHWLKQSAAHLQRLEASPKALDELERLGERLRVEIYER